MPKRPKKASAVILVDLGFGDCTKGSTTDFLARRRRTHTNVRFSGGPQAGHNVVTADGRHHTFSQFGSATFVSGVVSYLSRFMSVNPLSMLVEARRLADLGVSDALARLRVDRECLVITPYQRAANRLREIARCQGIHGSCGMGVGETVFDAQRIGPDALRWGDIENPALALMKLRHVQEFKLADLAQLVRQCRENGWATQEILDLESARLAELFLEEALKAFRQTKPVDRTYLGTRLTLPGQVIFEGAQGILLDEWHGFMPFCTRATCTTKNALTLLREAEFGGVVERLGLVRAYMTRHGPGPFVTEDSHWLDRWADRHNVFDDWQRDFRVGWHDLLATKYAIAACGGLDGLVVSHLDRMKDLDHDWWVGIGYHLPYEMRAEAPEYFQVPDDNHFLWPIRGIKSIEPGHLERQFALTEYLMAATPVYDSFVRRGVPHQQACVEFLRRLSAETGLPVRIASHGPTAEDKVFLSV